MSSTALLVIDVQRSAFDGVFFPPIDRPEDLVSNARLLVDAAHHSGTPVIFVQHCEGVGQPFEVGMPHWEFHDKLTQIAGDLIIRKYASSAFEKTDLNAKLRALGVRDLVVCGLQSEHCVTNTSKSALTLGYNVRVASDGHSTWPSKGQTSKAIVEGVNSELQSLGAVLESTARIATILHALA
jgi:nicotinamidase-related amidase